MQSPPSHSTLGTAAMPIRFDCPTCGKTFSVRDELAGKTAQCRQCGGKVRIPGPAGRPAVAAPQRASKPATKPATQQAPKSAPEPPATILFDCPACGKSFAARGEVAGEPFRCDRCHEPLTIPGVDRTPDGPPPTFDEVSEVETRIAAPTSRVYIHHACGQGTEVGGSDFTHLADPFRPCSKTFCVSCRCMVPLHDVRWVETGETVADYRRRVRTTMPPGERLFYQGTGPAVGLVLGLVGGVLWSVVMASPPGAGGGGGGKATGLIAVVLGAIIGAVVGTVVLSTLLMRHVWGIDFRHQV